MNIEKPRFVPDSVIATLRNCGGMYECAKLPDGTCGPLVGYAGQYEDGDQLKNYVGFVYYNVAKGDQWAHIAGGWADAHARLLAGMSIDLLVAAPMGGISYMSALKQRLDCRGIFLEKKVLEAAQEGKREKSKLVAGRYEGDIRRGDRVVLIEDIVNNFSTTKQMIQVVEKAEAQVLAIACVVNRSLENVYWEAPERDPLRVFALEYKPTPQYRQDDPAVADHIAAGNIVWKPKDHWNKLRLLDAGE
jgi:orotate phosphoribosyltransferase